MIRLRLSELRKTAMDYPGMFQEFLEAGRRDGEHLLIEREQFVRLNQKFFTSQAGTIIHEVVAPVVKLLDGLLGTSLGNCGSCAEREMSINANLGSSSVVKTS
jgi:hypothetical protein